ncbi:NO-inducible flavohemoprotein [Pseudomonas sp. LJDD11]|uniref:NO-inducible flavohemoprotein n=1 Tax=unclassified Pseudomonas TaxID=196821 RepID=UPI0004F74A70|nr:MULTISPECIES: NO-inducible flavohemoprotein [unclassified Pseudomonas]MCQ9422399.1 NO-inducible flavohemoprotein [Pseudomonas sp. LJDD11]BAP45734.1 nitric oxide dioxygenase [Pseudomonas sp. StFLB209]
MFTDPQRAIIKATVPLLESGGEALTTHFYNMMLSEYPEVRPLFNQANQASGAQPRALANAVLMYARHIDRLEALGPLVGQIVNKHVALQILPEHYPIVGTCLLRAIREVLGEDIATDEVIDAWGAAYGQLADILIGAEEAAYQHNEQARGGWRGARPFKLVGKEKESAQITSFYFEPLDGGAVLDFTPGQYLGLKLNIDGQELRRNYSLSALANGRGYRISVKRDEQGIASRYLHDHLQVSDRVELFPPAGHFTLQDSSRPLVLISAGVGITPTLPMLESALASGRPITFIHSARNASLQAFRPWLQEQQRKHPQLSLYVCYSQPEAGDRFDAQGRLCQEVLASWLPADRNVDAYFLGPVGFMSSVRRDLKALGVPEAQSHHEFFGPTGQLPD